MKKMFLLVVSLLTLSFTGYSFDTSALQISIWAPSAQVIPDDLDISGLKLNLPYGSNHKVIGLDLGLVSRNIETAALQLNIANVSIDKFSGLQIGMLNYSGESSGLCLGVLYNAVESVGSGLSLAIVNTSLEFRGVQIGILNYTEFLTGFQIGIINIVKNSQVPFFPIINFCF